MFVRLVVSGGVNVGKIAEIQPGFYLVGKSSECQIRPESPTVAERHCLLQHKGRHFGICQLASGHRTLVNHKPVEYKKWVLLNHSDLLLIGDVPFIVVITAVDPNAEVQLTKPAQARSPALQLPPAMPKAKPKPTTRKKTADTESEQDTAELDVSDLGLDTDVDKSDLTDGIRWREE